MSGLQDFLTPFSHLLFANRDKAIVLLAALLGWFTIQLLVTRWRNERLQRDLAAAKSAPSSFGGRRYATNVPVEEPPAENGALPPVKGGRTYARNLGTALSKAGISGPQIYSPPSPSGWAPNANPGQPGMPQPQSGAPYAPQNAPWGAPAQPPASPWGYPAGGGRPAPGPPPSAAPSYQPQPSPQQPSAPMQPMTAPPSGPGFYGPGVAPPFGQPAFSPTTSGPAAPPSAHPGAPAGPPVTPPFGGTPPAGQAAEPAPDGGRRGKPKRRRFNFNVLENLERMVQPRAAEPLPPMGWTPPVAAPTPPVAPAASAPAVSATPESTVAPQPAPSAEAASPVKDTLAESPSLPLEFGPTIEEAPDAETPETAEKTAEPTGETEEAAPPVAQAEPEAEALPLAEVEPEAEAPPTSPPKSDARKSMRSMLFGEEPPAAREATSTAEPMPSEPEPVSSEASWASDRWAPTEDASSTPESESPTPEPAAEEPVVADAPELVAFPEDSEPQLFGAWKPTVTPQPEAEAEPVASVEARADAGAETPETPASGEGNGPNAGTVVIIEDDEAAASYYATLFRGNGYKVEVANDGVSGVDLCTRVQPQVILLDVMMPRQNGILVLQTLRASDETKNTPVVVMSNFSEPTLIKRAIQLGALEYVIKTQVEGPALLDAMPRWMNREKAFAAA